LNLILTIHLMMIPPFYTARIRRIQASAGEDRSLPTKVILAFKAGQ
jgi:hypothetical protein